MCPLGAGGYLENLKKQVRAYLQSPRPQEGHSSPGAPCESIVGGWIVDKVQELVPSLIYYLEL